MLRRPSFRAVSLSAAGAVASAALSLAPASCLRPPPESAAPAAAAAPPIAQAQVDAAAEAAPATAGPPYPFQDPDLPGEKRIDDLLSRMTLDEKVECLGTNPSVPRLGVVASGHVEGLHGLAMGGPGGWGKDNPVPTTTFPQAVGLAETWDPAIVGRAAAVEGREARYVFHAMHRGGLVVRAPNADMGRDPRWGRIEESYGEDPYFNGVLAVAFARGLQGDDPRYWQAASLLKHFLANSNEEGRGHTSSDFDERLFHEYYGAAFRAAIRDAHARAFMAAYNAYDGVPCTTQPVLREVTMSLWGNDGIICTDAGALTNLVMQHHQFGDLPAAAAAAVHAGITQFLDRFREPVREALGQGRLTPADVDDAVRRNFRVMLRLGLLDPPALVKYAQIDAATPPWESDEHKALARRVTDESIVLLKNARGLLPLDARSLKSIAVVGRWADSVLLDWYSGTPPYTVSALAGIRERAGDKIAVSYAPDDEGGRAAKIARDAAIAIVVVGNHPTGDAPWAKVALPSYGKEAVDRQSITLEDEALVQKIVAANRNTVVVLVSSFPYAIGWTAEHAPAILHMTHNSQELGHSLAAALFGDVNPAGRLVETWPRSMDQLPPMMDYDIRHGRTYLYFTGKPLFPFGFGLSYTTFAYSALATDADSLRADGATHVRVTVKNTGGRAGDEVVQLYVKHLGSRVPRPLEELKGFARVALGPAESKVVTLPLAATDLAYWDVSRHAFVVEPESVELRVGSSSSDIKLTKTLRISE
jgi:beta-glucosidase